MRIWTNRYPDDLGKEWIEKNEYGFMWYAEDYENKEVITACGFPVPEWFVIEKFVETGRVYDCRR